MGVEKVHLDLVGDTDLCTMTVAPTWAPINKTSIKLSDVVTIKAKLNTRTAAEQQGTSVSGADGGNLQQGGQGKKKLGKKKKTKKKADSSASGTGTGTAAVVVNKKRPRPDNDDEEDLVQSKPAKESFGLTGLKQGNDVNEGSLGSPTALYVAKRSKREIETHKEMADLFGFDLDDSPRRTAAKTVEQVAKDDQDRELEEFRARRNIPSGGEGDVANHKQEIMIEQASPASSEPPRN